MKIEVNFRADDRGQSFRFLRRGLHEFRFPSKYPTISTELGPYLVTSGQGQLLDECLKQIPREADSTVNFLVDLNAQLQKRIGCVIRMRRICRRRRTLWPRLGIVRELGVAVDPDLSPPRSRRPFFVFGYLIQLRPDIDPVEGPREVENDFTDLHA